MNNKNKIFVGCLALLLVVTVGYALFSETITINGTAQAKGNFDLGITCIENIGTGNATGTCNVQGNSVSTNSLLTKPTEEFYFTIYITNNGTIPAKIRKVTSPNNVDGWWRTAGDCAYLDSSTYVLAYYMGSYSCDSEYNSNDLVLEPGEKEEILILHSWLDVDDWSYNVEQPKLPNGEASIDYDVTFEFEQVTN